ncbi:tetratricopeptide repeat protein [Streptomyces echinoruber]|uniref:Molecular chaperone Tir n=1 Tax=Streptomyces echinoruber TaxID=68898 RepID=A0A918QTZ5_9ACTN|nr:tetratricopeptide repeat protein [Streptomyces echinoruber]GGZ68175.1 molecular chaperone Tir [Streptomyces echinoruber]
MRGRRGRSRRGNGPEARTGGEQISVTQSGEAQAASGGTANSGYRGPVSEAGSDWAGVRVSGTGPAIAAAPDAFANSGYIHQMNVGTLHMNARTAQEPASAPLPRRAFLAESRLPEKGKFPPSFLLRSDYKVVPFHGRRQELADLVAWCEDEEEIGLRLVTGPGGQGKTRLALEMIGWAEGRKWTAGRLRTDCDERTLRELCALPGDALAVVDYAEARPELLASLLTAAGERPAGLGRLRLLLLARSSGEWWTQARVTAPDRAAALMYDAEYELPALFGAAEDRPLMFREAVRRFAEAGGYPTEGVEPFEELVEDRFSSALALHMAALAALLDRDESLPASETFRDAAGRVLDHEQRYWSATARAAGLPDHRPRTLRAAMTAVTCCGAADRDEAVRLMECVPDLTGEHRRVLGQYADWAHQLHPGEHWLNPLEPDPLAERLVADALAQQPELTAALGRAAHAPHQQGTLWTVLARTAARFPAVREAFPEILANGSDSLWLAGAMVASYLPRPDLLQPALTDSVGTVGDPAFLLGAVQTMPHSHRNCDLKIAAAEQALRRYRAAERNIPAEAELHASLADGLVSANRFEEALESLRTAADLYRGLAHDEPDRYGGEYVRVLSNYAVQLTNCGHHREALEMCAQAFAAAERHCEADDWFTRAQIWWVRSSVLKGLKRPEKAYKAMVKAVEEWRTETRHSPAVRAYLPITLMNLANRLSDLGRHDEALAVIEESVEGFREQERLHPDPLNPSLPQALINYSQCLYACDRPQEGRAVLVEAVRRLLRLTEHHSPRLPLLWEALRLWGIRLHKSDFADPAVRAEYQELATIQQRDDWPTDGLRGEVAFVVMMDYGLKLADAGEQEAGAHWMNQAFALLPKDAGPRLRAVAKPPAPKP